MFDRNPDAPVTAHASRWMQFSVTGCCVFAAWVLTACSESHLRGGTSTETGNPPFIETSLIAQVESRDGVHLKGEAGAVTPGSTDVQVTNLVTGKTQTAKVAADGSFDIAVDGAPNDTYAVIAVDGTAHSQAAYVEMSTVTVAEGKSGKLSCVQLSNLTGTTVARIRDAADRACKTAGDCVRASTLNDCHDDCSGVAISSVAGKSKIEDAVAIVNERVCGDFNRDGCTLIHPPCLPVGPPANNPLVCIDGQCQEAGGAQPDGGTSCTTCFNRELSWGSSFGGEFKARYVLNGCNALTRTFRGGFGCTTGLECGAQAAPSTAALLRDLEDSDVVQALVSRAVFGGPFTPTGGLFGFVVDGMEVTINECTGENCDAVPQGVAQLRADLMLIETAGTCEPLCPPDSIFVLDWQDTCGVGSGPSCAKVCDTDNLCCDSKAHCLGMNQGTYGCSARKLCESISCP